MRALIFIFILIPLIGRAQNITKPEGLTASLDSVNRVIHLKWNPAKSFIAGYNLSVKRSNDQSFYLWGKAGLLTDADFDFKLKSSNGDIYTFKVCAVQNFPKIVRSEYSESIQVEVPSSFLPMVKLNEPNIKKRRVEISWTFEPKVPDLNGYLVHLDNNVIKVPKDKTSLVIDDLESGNHIVFVIAVSNTGLKSSPSTKRFIRIK